MSVLFTILTVLVVIASILVTVVVLLQNSKGGGLASNFVAGNQTFGVRKTADKITWGLVAFIFVFSVATTFSTTGSGKNEIDITDKVENASTDQVPEFPSAPVQQSAPAQEAPATEAAPVE